MHRETFGCTAWHSDAPSYIRMHHMTFGRTTWHSDATHDIRTHHVTFGRTTWQSGAPRDIQMHQATFGRTTWYSGAPRDMKTIKTKEVKPMKQIWCHWINWSSPAGGEEGAELFLTGTRASSFTSDSAAERLRFRAGGFIIYNKSASAVDSRIKDFSPDSDQNTFSPRKSYYWVIIELIRLLQMLSDGLECCGLLCYSPSRACLVRGSSGPRSSPVLLEPASAPLGDVSSLNL